MNRSLSARKAWVLLAILAASTASLTVIGCGTSSNTPAPATTASEEGGALTSSELAEYPLGSPERAFLTFWSGLQFQSWAEVAAFYNPRFREYIGVTTILAAKKLNYSVYQSLKPRIARVREGSDRMTTIYYTVSLADGSKEAASISWRKADGNWRIVYDSRLDAELNQLARNRVEIDRTGALPTDPSTPPSPQGLRAGQKAAELQAHFLQQELKSEKP